MRILQRPKSRRTLGWRTLKRIAALVAVFLSTGALLAASSQVVDLAGRPADPLGATGVKATVLIFTRADCPISNRYAPEIQRIYREFAPSHVAFWLVFVDPSEPPGAIRRHVTEYGYSFGALRDPAHALVRLTGASITPEVAVFTGAGSAQRMVYRGRIDDKYVDFGKERPEPTTHDLEQVLKAIAEGKSPKPETTRAVGCFISDLETR